MNRVKRLATICLLIIVVLLTPKSLELLTSKGVNVAGCNNPGCDIPSDFRTTINDTRATMLSSAVVNQTELASWLNARRDFSAKGNGIADDTIALQNGIDLLEKNINGGRKSVLYIPAGTYRITGTLKVQAKLSSLIIGDLNSTIIQWDGPVDGIMLHVNGSKYSHFRNLILEGSNKAGIAIYNGWDGKTGYESLKNTFEYLTLRNTRQACFKAGNRAVDMNDSEGLIQHTLFTNCGQVAFQTDAFNSKNWWIENSVIELSKYGISNDYHGTFLVRNTSFNKNSEGDIYLGGDDGIAVHDSTSTGSPTFFYSYGNTQYNKRVLLERNTVTDILNPLNLIVAAKDPGPYLLLDNIFNSGRDNVPSVVVDTNVPGDVFALRNAFSSPDPVVSTRKTLINNSVITGTTTITNTQTLPIPSPLGNIFEVSDYGNDADAVQSAIDAAVVLGSKATIHFSSDREYTLNKTVTIPANIEITLLGDSQTTRLKWTGDNNGIMFRLLGPSKASIEELYINMDYRGIAIQQEDVNQSGGNINIDGIAAYRSSEHTVQILGASSTNIQISHLLGITSNNVLSVDSPGSSATGGIVHVTSASFGYNETDYEVLNDSRVIIQDAYTEHSKRYLYAKGDGLHNGFITLQGNIIKTDRTTEPSAILLENYTGNFSILQSRIVNVNQSGLLGTQIIQKGTLSPAIVSIGNNYANSKPILANNVTQLNDRVFTGVSYFPMDDSPNLDSQRIEAALLLQRSYIPKLDFERNLQKDVTSASYKNILFENCAICIKITAQKSVPVIVSDSR